MSNESKPNPRLPLLGAHVTEEIYDAVLLWVEQDPERSIAIFVREAAREKLRADGIFYSDRKRKLGRD